MGWLHYHLSAGMLEVVFIVVEWLKICLAVHSWHCHLHYSRYASLHELRIPNFADHDTLGTAAGDLGRHTKIGHHGKPEITHRTQVFQQVSMIFASSAAVVDIFPDQLCLTVDLDFDLWPNEIVSASDV